MPPMFSRTQSFLEGASGVGTKEVALRPKSPGSMVVLEEQVEAIEEEGCGWWWG